MMHSRSRQHAWRRTGLVLCVAAALLVSLGTVSAATGDGDGAEDSTVRLLTIGATRTGGFLDGLVADFEEASGYTVVVTNAGPDIFDQARHGNADLVMAHLGFTPLHDFVASFRGHWPATVFSNTVAFLIPPDDPAGVRDAADPVEAFELIAEAEAPFVVNNLGETLYITDTLWNAVGRPDGEWFIDLGQSGVPAVREAERRGGYTIWGLHPFLNLRQQQGVDLEPVVYNDSLMQRIIATVVVRRPRLLVNEKGAFALQEYLTQPATQAQIRSFRLPGIDEPVFWPAGNQNDN
jgi:tungstate transport system substrate-binding protein